jgi:glycosyltransferase involved in cell wall biosynthesis
MIGMSKMNDCLTLYLVCHNRPDDARRAITTILKQSDLNFTFIVSDNSSDDCVSKMIEQYFPSLCYVRRQPVMPALEHFNCCIAEVKTNYFCLFHDDDLLHFNFISEMKGLIRSTPNAIAWGCNAQIEKHGELTGDLLFKSLELLTWNQNRQALVRRYFARSQSGVAPFPGYFYNRELIGDERMPIDGGKYADVTWLLNLAVKAPVVWVNKVLMTYRLHASNDGGIESRRDRLRFLAYLKINRKSLGEDILQDYRCSFIYKKIRYEQHLHSRIRYERANRFLNYYRWARYLRISTYEALVVRAAVKLRNFR